MSASPGLIHAFVGPSISADEAARCFPGATIRPPIRRGDLYEAREAGAWGAIVIDGVFMQQLAVSPGEVIDVLRDGAFLAGASSMGALRAAECWPAGMVCSGLIARMFRIGWLDSDDEVAVTIDAERGFRAASVPLVNVRYSLSRAARRGVIDRARANEILGVAQQMHYGERTWRWIFHTARLSDPEARTFCETVDLKHRDALGALRTVDSAVRAGALPPARFARTADGPVGERKHVRERLFNAAGGRDLAELQQELLVYALGSGRIMEHLLPLLASGLGRHSAGGSFAAGTAAAHRRLVDRPAVRSLSGRAAALRDVLDDSLGDLLADRPGLGAALWSELRAAGELDAYLMTMRAIETGATTAASTGVGPTIRARHLAETEIAHGHGFPSFDALRASRRWKLLGEEIDHVRAKTTAAKAWRAQAFRRRSDV